MRARWEAFSATGTGDLVATAIAILATSVLFLVCTFIVFGVLRGWEFVVQHYLSR